MRVQFPLPAPDRYSGWVIYRVLLVGGVSCFQHKARNACYAPMVELVDTVGLSPIDRNIVSVRVWLGVPIILMLLWWNWQTRQTQNLLLETVWEFESLRKHQSGVIIQRENVCLASRKSRVRIPLAPPTIRFPFSTSLSRRACVTAAYTGI